MEGVPEASSSYAGSTVSTTRALTRNYGAYIFRVLKQSAQLLLPDLVPCASFPLV